SRAGPRDRRDFCGSAGTRWHLMDTPRPSTLTAVRHDRLSGDVRLPGHGVCACTFAAMAACAGVVCASDGQSLVIGDGARDPDDHPLFQSCAGIARLFAALERVRRAADRIVDATRPNPGWALPELEARRVHRRTELLALSLAAVVPRPRLESMDKRVSPEYRLRRCRRAAFVLFDRAVVPPFPASTGACHPPAHAHRQRRVRYRHSGTGRGEGR